MILHEYENIALDVPETEDAAVKTAALSFRKDLMQVLHAHVGHVGPQEVTFHIRTIPGKVKEQYEIRVGGATEGSENAAGTPDVLDETGRLRPAAPEETILLPPGDPHEIWLTGTDRRGTIYAMYTFSEEILGVSPWTFLADVPYREVHRIAIPDDYVHKDHPNVEYRGIFINDEEELERWVREYMGEETIGPKTYVRIFELLLRLKLNYIWPAMHVNSFNANPENGALADRMGIVIGTSHCDMLMRSNYREWKPWLRSHGYDPESPDAPQYDYSIPGKNREILQAYWQESAQQNKDFECCYTLGMRGIHDSGFTTSALEEQGFTGEALTEAKCRLLEEIIAAQEKILEETIPGDRPVLKTFVPYKEVLNLYDHGLQVPEDITLIWVNDNYGYVRRYPDEKEKKRKGGNGLYYHNSYWAPPGGSYLFLDTIPLAHTRNELQKAYDEGIRKIWVTNFGSVKPYELQISYYAALAWDMGKENSPAFDDTAWLDAWIDRTFSGSHGSALAPLLTRFDQVANTRKVEHMDNDVFSQTAYDDEAAGRIHVFEKACQTADAIYEQLPQQERDAFYELILMRLHAVYFTALMYYGADRSNLCGRQGKDADAAYWARRSREAGTARTSMVWYYNHILANGKWNGILTPEDFPPVRTAMEPALDVPAAVLAGEEEPSRLILTWPGMEHCGGNSLEINPRYAVRVEAGFTGSVNAYPSSVRVVCPEGTVVNGQEGPAVLRLELKRETALLVQALPGTEEGQGGSLSVSCDAAGQTVILPLQVVSAQPGTARNGRITLEAEDGELVAENGQGTPGVPAPEDEQAESVESTPGNEHTATGESEPGNDQAEAGWVWIPHLGRDHGSLVQAERTGAAIRFRFIVRKAEEQQKATLEIHRFPSLNSVGRIRVEVQLDQRDRHLVESDSPDEWTGHWEENRLNEVDRLTLPLGELEAGEHTITLYAVDRYFAFSRLVIYYGAIRSNSLGYPSADQRLPEDFDAIAFARGWYSAQALAEAQRPKPVLYAWEQHDPIANQTSDIYVVPTGFGDPVTPEFYRQEGARPVVEALPSREARNASMNAGIPVNGLLIDAASALCGGEAARISSGVWQFAYGSTHHGTGLCLYLPKGTAEASEEDALQGKAPSLRYRFQTVGGRYRVWAHVFIHGTNTDRFTIALDGRVIPEKDLFGGKQIWEFSNEYYWRWAQVYSCDLSEGMHELTFFSRAYGLRVDQFALLREDENGRSGLPPAQA